MSRQTSIFWNHVETGKAVLTMFIKDNENCLMTLQT